MANTEVNWPERQQNRSAASPYQSWVSLMVQLHGITLTRRHYEPSTASTITAMEPRRYSLPDTDSGLHNGGCGNQRI